MEMEAERIKIQTNWLVMSLVSVASAAFARVPGAILGWGICEFFRFCQSFTSNFSFSFLFPFLSLSLSLQPGFRLRLKRTLSIYPMKLTAVLQVFGAVLFSVFTVANGFIEIKKTPK